MCACAGARTQMAECSAASVDGVAAVSNAVGPGTEEEIPGAKEADPTEDTAPKPPKRRYVLKISTDGVTEDMSVAGFDNYRVIAETLYPPLTTVELAYAAIGARAAQRLLSLISGEPEEQTNPTLVSGPVSWRSSVTVKNSLHMFESKGRINP